MPEKNSWRDLLAVLTASRTDERFGNHNQRFERSGSKFEQVFQLSGNPTCGPVQSVWSQSVNGLFLASDRKTSLFFMTARNSQTWPPVHWHSNAILNLIHIQITLIFVHDIFLQYYLRPYDSVRLPQTCGGALCLLEIKDWSVFVAELLLWFKCAPSFGAGFWYGQMLRPNRTGPYKLRFALYHLSLQLCSWADYIFRLAMRGQSLRLSTFEVRFRVLLDLVHFRPSVISHGILMANNL